MKRAHAERKRHACWLPRYFAVRVTAFRSLMWVLSRWLEKAHPAKAISRLPPGNRGKDHPIKPRRRDGQILAAADLPVRRSKPCGKSSSNGRISQQHEVQQAAAT